MTKARKLTTLHQNEYCRIVEDKNGNWWRVDKILQTTQEVNSYFDKNEKLIKKQ